MVLSTLLPSANIVTLLLNTFFGIYIYIYLYLYLSIYIYIYIYIYLYIYIILIDINTCVSLRLLVLKKGLLRDFQRPITLCTRRVPIFSVVFRDLG